MYIALLEFHGNKFIPYSFAPLFSGETVEEVEASAPLAAYFFGAQIDAILSDDEILNLGKMEGAKIFFPFPEPDDSFTDGQVLVGLTLSGQVDELHRHIRRTRCQPSDDAWMGGVRMLVEGEEVILFTVDPAFAFCSEPDAMKFADLFVQIHLPAFDEFSPEPVAFQMGDIGEEFYGSKEFLHTLTFGKTQVIRTTPDRLFTGRQEDDSEIDFNELLDNLGIS